MDIDTQNKFSEEEEDFINRISDTLRQYEEHKAIKKTVSDKIASTQFGTASNSFFGTPSGRIIAYGSLAVAAAVVLFFVMFRSPETYKGSEDLTFVPAAELVAPSVEQAKIPEDNASAPDNNTAGNKRRTERRGGPVPGLPLSANEQKMMMMKRPVEEHSFMKTYEFDAGSIKRFKTDLKRELNKLGLKFTDKSNRDDIVLLVSEKARAVSENSRHVEYYIIAKVNRRYPKNLNMSLRYYEIDEQSVTGYVKSVNTIFYNNLHARVGNLIKWKYKPETK